MCFSRYLQLMGATSSSRILPPLTTTNGNTPGNPLTRPNQCPTNNNSYLPTTTRTPHPTPGATPPTQAAPTPLRHRHNSNPLPGRGEADPRGSGKRSSRMSSSSSNSLVRRGGRPSWAGMACRNLTRSRRAPGVDRGMVWKGCSASRVETSRR